MVDDLIRKIEQEYEVTYGDVPDSGLNEILNNPVDKGIDPGQDGQVCVSRRPMRQFRFPSSVSSGA